MRPTTERDSLAIDDLVVGRSYEFISPRGHVYRGVWEGMDRHTAGVRFPPGAMDMYPHGTTLVYSVRKWAACTITAMEPEPTPQSDLAALRKTWPAVLGCALVWGAAIAWVFELVWRR